MSYRARAYIGGVLLAAAVVAGRAFEAGAPSPLQWATWALLATLAALAQLFRAETPHRQNYYVTTVFFFAGVVLLPPSLFVLLVIAPHAVEWATERLRGSDELRDWYLQPFNAAMHILAGQLAFAILSLQPGPDAMLTAPVAATLTLAVLVYALLNHLLAGIALVVLRKASWRESGVLRLESLTPDIALLCLGLVVAFLWQTHPWLVAPALAPLAVVHRALAVPRLREQAQTDAKTGLWNAGHFDAVFASELDRAKRFGRPLAVIMADLDLLRDINNAYGHLAGDSVLAGIGAIIRSTIREYDSAARFGGEEFAIVLPEVGPIDAYLIAERLRSEVAAAVYAVPASSKSVRATMSLGVACYPGDGTTTTMLIREADAGVYQAKLQGRNRVVVAADVPQVVKLQTTSGVAGDPGLETVHPATSAVGGMAASARTSGEHGRSWADSIGACRRLPNVPLRHAFVAGVILAAIGVAAYGVALNPLVDLTTVALLGLLAIAAEWMQIRLYGDTTVSVAVAFTFGAALIAGIPGVVVVGTALALGQTLRTRPALHKMAFNWALHVLGGAVPAVALSIVATPATLSSIPRLALPMAAAALLLYAVEAGGLSCELGLSTGSAIPRIWREHFAWLLPHYVVLCAMGLLLAAARNTSGIPAIVVFSVPVLMMRYSQKQYVERTEESMRELNRMSDELTKANLEILVGSHAIHGLNNELFMTLAKIFDARDPYVGGHAAQVAGYAAKIAAEMGLPPERVEVVRRAGLLHDIGKIAIAEAVLHKPGKLTEQEYEYVKTHVTIGAELLETSQGLRQFAPFIRHHHERWDGRGYPSGLQGEEIPLEARILNVCDSVEAMASDRPYHAGMAVHAVIAEVRRCAGTQFDPVVAETFVRIAEREGDQLVVNSARKVAERRGDQHRRLPAATAPESAVLSTS